MRCIQAEVLSLEDFVKTYSMSLCNRQAGRFRIGLTSGGFDPLHPGHASCILASSNECDLLIVAVNGDNFLTKKKGRSFMDVHTRCGIVSHLMGVSYVVSFDGFNEDDLTAIRPLEVIRPHVFLKGGDRKDPESLPEWEVCQRLGIEVKFGMGADKVWSSTDFLKKWTDNG
jgi:cytidyltransferase-like protein